MAKGFKHGGGSLRELELRVVGSLIQPTDARENDIWVQTDAMTDWWIGPTEPEAREGLVWIRTGSGGTALQVLVRHAMVILPTRAKLCSGGAWTEVEMRTYSGGAWQGGARELISEAFRAQTVDDAAYSLPTEADPRLTASATYVNSTKQGHCLVETQEAFDLTGVSTVVFTVDQATVLGNKTYKLRFYVADAQQTNTWGEFSPTVMVEVQESLTQARVELDVSALSGSFYVGLFVRGSYSPTGTQSCTVSSILLE